LHAGSASENPANALRRIGERALEPALERFVSKGFGRLLGGDFEERVNSCLDRSFMQKVAAEGVYRADTSEFQVLERPPAGPAPRVPLGLSPFRFRSGGEASSRRRPSQ
jgi:hypothetical protein